MQGVLQAVQQYRQYISVGGTGGTSMRYAFLSDRGCMRTSPPAAWLECLTDRPADNSTAVLLYCGPALTHPSQLMTPRQLHQVDAKTQPQLPMRTPADAHTTQAPGLSSTSKGGAYAKP